MEELCNIPNGSDFYYNGIRYPKIGEATQVEIKCYNHTGITYEYFGKYTKVKPVK